MTGWTEESTDFAQEYVKCAYMAGSHNTFIRGIKFKHPQRFFHPQQKFGWNFCLWEEKVSWKPLAEPIKKKTFGLSLSGIKTGEEEVSIDAEALEPNIFYLFSYKNEKYIARKTDENVVEIFEVVE